MNKAMVVTGIVALLTCAGCEDNGKPQVKYQQAEIKSDEQSKSCFIGLDDLPYKTKSENLTFLEDITDSTGIRFFDATKGNIFAGVIAIYDPTVYDSAKVVELVTSAYKK